MSFLDTSHKRKSAVITSMILMLLVFGVFNVGMKYLDPPIEYGVAINFGDSDVGSGDPVEDVLKEAVEEEVVEEKEEIDEEIIQEEATEKIEEEVLTDEASKEVTPIEKKEEVKEVVKKEQPKKEESKPKPSKAASDALNSLLKGTSDDGTNKGEGDDKEQGQKGKEGGDPDAKKYYGNTGKGSGGNYNLAGRKALSKPIKQPDCQEEGVVVVSIEVNQNGKVVKAIPGVKGTTNTAPCLLGPAKVAALGTIWNPDGNAPTKQKGTIIYKFSLSK